MLIQTGPGQWVEVGDASPAPTVPASVTKRQAALALQEIGQLDAVEVAISALPEEDRERAKIEWQYATTIDRQSLLTALLAASLGLDEEKLDQLFTHAATL